MSTANEVYNLWLPVATSVNAMYTHTSRGVESSAEKLAWETRAWRLLQRQYPDRPVGKPAKAYRAQLVMHVFLATWTRDISNTIKLTEDLLASYFQFDDRYMVAIQVGRVTAPTRDEEKVHVRLTLTEYDGTTEAAEEAAGTPHPLPVQLHRAVPKARRKRTPKRSA